MSPRVLRVAALVVAVLVATRVYDAWVDDRFLGHVSGVWSALAWDLAHGELFRPLADERGYGGTRYFPLHPALHAVLMQLGAGPRLGGYAIALGSTAALLAGLWTLGRRAGVERGLVAASLPLVFAGQAVQYGLVTIRGDALPAALALWGIALATGGERPVRPRAAGLCLALAFAAKPTSLYAAAAALGGLLAQRRRHDALWLAVTTAGGIAAFAALVHVASDGRVVENLTGGATAGAQILSVLGRGPAALVREAVRSDPGGGVLVLVALALVLRRAPRELAGLRLALLLCLGATAVILGSPGARANNLLDLELLAFAVIAVEARLPERRRLVRASLVVAAAVTCTAALLRPPNTGADVRDQLDQAAARVARTPGAVLVEHPLVPVLADRRPLLLDPFALRLVGDSFPEVRARFLEELCTGEFELVLLQSNPARRSMEELHFGAGFVDALAEGYELSGRVGAFWAFEPRAWSPARRPTKLTR